MGGKNVSLSRRSFLSRGSLGVAVAGAAALVPGLSAVLKLPAPPMSRADASAATAPLIAHVRDVASGEVSIMVGTDHVVLHDANLAARLYGAALTSREKGR
jgi:hypothetical protein